MKLPVYQGMARAQAARRAARAQAAGQAARQERPDGHGAAGAARLRDPIRMEYRTGNELDLDQVIELYKASTLGERRPVDDRERMGKMLAAANLVITAWEGGTLMGIARSVTDGAYCTYLSDLAVRLSHQRQGIGRELMRRTQAAAPEATLILLAAPKAAEYYPHVGFSRHESCWILRPGETIASEAEQ